MQCDCLKKVEKVDCIVFIVFFEEVIENEKEGIFKFKIWIFKVDNVCDFVWVFLCKFVWDVCGY